MRLIKNGATSQSIDVIIRNVDGDPITGLVYNSTNLIASYALLRNTSVAITLATLAAANSAWSSGGFKEVDATKHPGRYRLDLPDAACTGADSCVVTLTGYANMVSVDEEIQFTTVDLQAASGAVTLSTASIAAIWAYVVEGTTTAVQYMRLMAAALLAKLSGAGGTTITIRDVPDTKNRIVATVDANGNRSAFATMDGT